MYRLSTAFVVVSLATVLALPLAAQRTRPANPRPQAQAQVQPQPQVNFALQARVTFSSSDEQGSWSAKFAVDGERNERAGARGWSSSADRSRNHTEWIRIDLGTGRALGRVDLYPRNDPARLGEGFPVDFTIQISENGSDWTTVVQKTNYPKPGDAVQSFPFGPANARYIQIIGRNLRYLGAERAYFMQFAEIEAYGPSADVAGPNPGGASALANSSWQGEIVLGGRTRTFTATIDGANRIAGAVMVSSGGSAAQVALQGAFDPATGEITLRYGGSGAPGGEQATLTGTAASASEASGQGTVITRVGSARRTSTASWRMTRR